MANIKIYLENTYTDSNSKVAVFLDNLLVSEHTIDTKIIEFDCDLINDWHLLEVALIKYNQTRTAVNIDQILVNGSAMNYLLNDFGKVIPNWENELDLQQWYITNEGTAPDEFLKRRILDMDGKYEFKFKLPIKEFLDNFYKIPAHYTKYYNSSMAGFEKIEKMLHAQTK